AYHFAVRVERRGPLAQVPDVAGTVLGVPVSGSLLETTAQVELVVDHRCPYALDRQLLVSDGQDVDRGLAVLDARVSVHRSGTQRIPRVVDPAHELGRRRQCRY